MIFTRTMELASFLVVLLLVHNDAIVIEDLERLSPLIQSKYPRSADVKQRVQRSSQIVEKLDVGTDLYPTAAVSSKGPDFVPEQQRNHQRQAQKLSTKIPAEYTQLEDDMETDYGTKLRILASANSTNPESNKTTNDYVQDVYHRTEVDPSCSLEEQEEEVHAGNTEEDVASMSQHFFPSFTPIFPAPHPLGHSRPSLFQERDNSQRPALVRPQHNSFQPINFGRRPFHDNSYLHSVAAAEVNTNNILGSGNFGVIRGGTFYSDEDNREISDYTGRGNTQFYNPYYTNNGHGRPIFYSGGGSANPRPQQHRGNDFFANFRDFAEINTPTKSSFSEYIVVYMNKNGSSKHDHGNDDKMLFTNTAPRNINEQLKMLDQVQETPVQAEKIPTIKYSDLEPTKATKKTSSTFLDTKNKISMFQDKHNKQKVKKTKATTQSPVQKYIHEPLLAVS